MNRQEHEELRSLLGAFALNATSAAEHREVQRHLATCDECAHEVRLLGDAAAELAWLPSSEDADALVDRIAESLPARPRRVMLRAVATIAAISLAAAGFLGAALVRERSESRDLAQTLSEATRRVRLESQSGFGARGTLHLAQGRAVIALDDLPDAGRDRSYQLWAISGTTPRSMTVIDGRGRVVKMFEWRGRAERFALTIEPEGGSPVPTTDPVLAGT